MLVVSHARIIRALFSKGVLEGSNKPGCGFQNPKFVANCEIVPVIASSDEFLYEN